MFIGADKQDRVDLSVIIPAHNEEKYIKRCLNSIAAAAESYKGNIEVIVVLNRCTDQTKQIAESYHCVTITEDSKNLSLIRNVGVRAARGNIIVTIDADSWMAENMLAEVGRLLSAGKTIGGGVGSIKFERVSLGIVASALIILLPLMLKYGNIAVGMFWCYKKDFEAIHGFDERMLMTEDADFAKRLKQWGKKQGKAFGIIRTATLFTSTRKFDKMGDWAIFKNPSIIKGYWTGGRNREAADLAYYENQQR
ncbi:glycosyltransferase [Paenibacillus sp. MMS18-CY102]|uniref:glycosyltransferase n=1 Tax=Paenibacillus sp. MMS18-CY102 TaxID=2682849 RepID=UPI00136576EC|nr:glycosyltransferase [Paenibacillus sp. MMS18-CY102]MWC29380.1 glycosyltransferase [Paenibacillus sp. MMS18-CY102]